MDKTEEQNPFAAPLTEQKELKQIQNFAIEGDRVIGSSPIRFPEVCVKCGVEASEGKRLRKKLTYAPLWKSVLIVLCLLLNLLIGLILAYFLQQNATVEYSLCKRCNSIRFKKRSIAGLLWCSFVAAIVLPVSGVLFLPQPVIGMLILILFIAALVASFVAADSIKLADYVKPCFYVRGMDPSFFVALETKEKPEDSQSYSSLADFKDPQTQEFHR